MWRCYQLIRRLCYNHYIQDPFIPRTSADLKPPRIFYTTEPSSLVESVNTLPPNETGSTLCVPKSRLINNTSPVDSITVGAGQSTRHDPMPDDREGTYRSVETGTESSQLTDDPEDLLVTRRFVLKFKTSRSKAKSLFRDLMSTPELANDIGFINSLIDAITAPASLHESSTYHATSKCGDQSNVDIVKLTLQLFGSQFLHKLDARRSADLLCFLGSVSDKQSFDLNRFETFLHVHSDCWEEIIKIAEVKQQLGHFFGEKENYWSMRAYLERGNLRDGSVSREMAKFYYSRLSTWQSKAFVLIPYLDALLTHGSMPDFDHALNTLCTSLAKTSIPDQTLVERLWRVVQLKYDHLSPLHKSTILNLILHRLSLFDFPDSGTRSDQGLFFTNLPFRPRESDENIFLKFAATIFPCYRKPGSPASTTSWIKEYLRARFTEETPLNERFDNLVFMAKWLLPVGPSSLSKVQFASDSSELRTILAVGILDQLLSARAIVFEIPTQVNDIARYLLDKWKHNITSPRPRAVERTVAIAFLQISFYLRDKVLLDTSAEDIFSGTLWAVSLDQESDTSQMNQLCSALANSICVFKHHLFPRLLSLFVDKSHSISRRNSILCSIIQQVAQHDADLAFQFYEECCSRQISVPPKALFAIAQQLTSKRGWNHIATLLRDAQFDGIELEWSLETILLIFLEKQHRNMTPMLAGAIGDALLRRFSITKAPDRLKSLIQYFLPVLITSQHPEKAFEVLKVLLENNPVMFSSQSFFQRMIDTLLRHREPTLATKTLHLVADSHQLGPVVINGLARKTRRGLVQAGATKMAFSPALVGNQPPPKNLHDQILELSKHKSSRAAMRALVRLFPALTTPPVKSPLILAAVQKLVRHRRFALARWLMERSLSHLESEGITAIGNAYLHAPLLHPDPRNKRLVRRILCTKDYLVQKYGFVPDRITVNILIKAMLRWKIYIDSRMIMSLFDHLIRNGYPASERWHIANGVPFGTKPGKATLDLSGVRPSFSFNRHIRPLYKMFITGLLSRKNTRAARRIVRILQEEEALALERQEHRDRVRRLGRIKALTGW